MFYHVEQRADDFTAFAANQLSFYPHIHPHLELVYLSEGRTLASADRNTVIAQAGDLFLSFPNQIHFYNDQEPVSVAVLIVSPELFSDFKDLFQKRIPREPLIKKDRLPPDVAGRIDTILRRAASEDPYHRIAAKGYLTALLAEVLRLMDWVDCPTGHDSTKNVMIYCLENYTQPLSLDTLAAELHLSKFYISRIFKERMGIGFSDFINTLRVEHACELLEKGRSITDVAFASGFSSIRSFNRLFSRNMGMTPTEFIRRKSAV